MTEFSARDNGQQRICKIFLFLQFHNLEKRHEHAVGI